MLDIERPKCAILLAVYNGMPYLEEQVQTILGQQDVEVKIFVSIDPSSDESEAWLKELATREPRLLILTSGERFGGAARNFFRLIRDVDFSLFDFVAFSDQDDCWYPDKLSRAATILSDSGYDGYSSNVIAFWPNAKRLLIDKSQPQRSWDYVFEAAGPGCTYVMTVNLMSKIKAKMLEIWDRLQEVSLHDWYCYAFARANQFKWYIDPEPSMLYRQHNKNQVGVNLGMKAYLNRFRKIKNGWWLTQALLIAELVGISDSSFIQGWSKLGARQLLHLSIYTFQCRRRLREQVIFLLVCMGLALTGGQKQYRKGIEHLINSEGS